MTTSTKPAVYIVSSAKGRIDLALRRLKDRPFYWIYLGQNVTTSVKLTRHIGERGERIHLSKFLHRAASRLREPYIDYVGELSQLNSSLLWWASSLAGKNPYKSHLLLNTAYIEACLEVLESLEGSTKTLLITAESKAVRESLNINLKARSLVVHQFQTPIEGPVEAGLDLAKFIFYKSYFVLSESLRIFLASIVHRTYNSTALNRSLESGKPLTVIHTWLDHRSFDMESGCFRDPDFDGLMNYLKAQEEDVVLVPYIHRSLPYSIVIKALRDSLIPFLIPHSLFRIVDVLRAMINSAKPVIRESGYPALNDLDVRALIKEDLRHDWRHHDLAKNLMFSSLVHRMKGRNFRLRRLIYHFENHAWERVLCKSIRQVYPQARLVGFLPTVVSKLQTNYFISRNERALVPMPHRVVTNGPYTTNLLKKAYIDNIVVEGGALRQGRFLKRLSGSEKRLDHQNDPLVIIAPSVSPDEAAELVLIAYLALKDVSGIQVVIKCHPANPFSRFSHKVDLNDLPPHFGFSEENLSILLDRGTALVYTSSGAVLEALATNVSLIHLNSSLDLYWDPLDSCPKVRLEAYSPQDLTDSVLRVLTRGPSEYASDGASSIALSKLLSQPTIETYKRFTL